MTQMDASRFAIGAGRGRPPYEPRKLDCPQCGGPIPLRDERAQTVICDHCRSQVELTAGQARAIGAVGEAPAGFLLSIGAPFEWEGVRYEVCGRIAKGDAGEEGDPEEQLTYTYLLYNPRHPSLWLSCYAGQWGLSRRTRVLPAGNAFEHQPGSVLQTHDGRQWKNIEVGVAEIRYVDGALPWLAQVGDRTHVAEFEAADGSGELYEAEYSPRGEIEYGHGRRLSAEEVEQATGGLLQEDDLEQYAVELSGEKPRLRAIGCITLLFGAVALVTGLTFIFLGNRAFSETIPPEGGEVGPVTIKKPNTVLEIDIRQGFRKDGWSWVEGEVLDQDKEYLFGFGQELWAESGYDDGPWHEEKNDYDLNVTIPEKGKYFLKLNTDVGVQGGRGLAETRPQEVGGPIKVTVSQKRGSSLPFMMAGIIALILGLLLYEAATGRARKAVSEMESD